MVVLRCSPDVLESRLSERGYQSEKVQSNSEWELIGGSWNEYEADMPWVEFDTTASDVESIVASITGWIADGFKPASQSPGIDWIERMGD